MTEQVQNVALAGYIVVIALVGIIATALVKAGMAAYDYRHFKRGAMARAKEWTER